MNDLQQYFLISHLFPILNALVSEPSIRPHANTGDVDPFLTKVLPLPPSVTESLSKSAVPPNLTNDRMINDAMNNNSPATKIDES